MRNAARRAAMMHMAMGANGKHGDNPGVGSGIRQGAVQRTFVRAVGVRVRSPFGCTFVSVAADEESRGPQARLQGALSTPEPECPLAADTQWGVRRVFDAQVPLKYTASAMSATSSFPRESLR